MSKEGNFLTRIPSFANEVRAEAHKIVWPSSRETIMTTVMVVIMTSMMGVFFFGIDAFFGQVVQWLLSLAHKV